MVTATVKAWTNVTATFGAAGARPSAAPDASLMRRYEELLSRPNLWLADVDQVRWLAHQLDRRVEFVKVPVWPGK